MPPAAPIRGAADRSRAAPASGRASASIVGSRTIAGWLSVWPPESASAVMSSAIGIRAAHSACSGVISPAATSSRRNCAGGGAMNLDATSTRETLAMIRFGATTRPEPSRRMPATR